MSVASPGTASVQSTQTDAWSLCTPLFDQLVQNVQNGPTLNQVLLQLWQTVVTLNT